MKKEGNKPGNQEDEEADGDVEDEKTCEQGDDNAAPFGDNLDALTPDEQLSRQLISLRDVAKSRREPQEAFVKSKTNEAPKELENTQKQMDDKVSKTSTVVPSAEGKPDKETEDLKKDDKKKEARKEDKPCEQEQACKKNAVARPMDEVKKNAVAEKVKEDPAELEKQKKKENSLENARKLEKLRQKLKKSDQSKRPGTGKKKKKSADAKRGNSEARKKRKRKTKPTEENKKKTIADKIRDQFQAVRSLFSGATAGKVEKTVQAKLSKKNTRLGNVADGDDILPQIGVKERDIDDCWIEDPAVLTDRSHRPDLVLVSNNDNSGNLWHENVRPFWRNKILQKEVPQIPPEKTMSKMLLDVIYNKAPIAGPASDPTPFFNPLLPTDALALKDDLWFKDKLVLANTFRSIISSQKDTEIGIKKETDSQLAEKSKLTFKEPDTQISYYRHDNTKRETVPFVKSTVVGKPRRLKKANSPSSSSSSSISASASTATSPTDAARLTDQNANKKPKDKPKVPDHERSGMKKVVPKKK